MNIQSLSDKLLRSGKLKFLFEAAILRRFTGYSLRSQLLTTFIGVVVLTVVIISLFNSLALQSQLTEDAGENVQNLAQIKAQAVGASLSKLVDTLEALSVNQALQVMLEQSYSARLNRNPEVVKAELQAIDQKWLSAGSAGNDIVALSRAILTGPITIELLEFRNKFPDNYEVLVTDSYGAVVGATNMSERYYYGNEPWWRLAYKEGRGGLYIGVPESGKIMIAIPVYGRTNQVVVGVLRTTLSFNVLLEVLLYDEAGQLGQADLLLPEGALFIARPDGFERRQFPPEISALLAQLQQDGPAYIVTTYDGTPSLVSQIAVSSFDPGSRLSIAALNWHIIASHHRDEALQAISTSWLITFFTGLVALLIAGGSAFTMAALLTRPISRLTEAARRFGRGDLSVRAEVEAANEIGMLAQTFNGMTERLQQSLEQLSRHAQMLQTSAEVARAVSVSLDRDEVLRASVNLICERFGFYYAQVFTIDPGSDVAVLREATGEVGKILKKRRHQLFIGSQSLTGTATATGKPCIAQDVADSVYYLMNPLLTETRAEASFPLMVGDVVIGALDVQSRQAHIFTPDMVALLSTLADQIAIAVQHARLYHEQQKLAEHYAEVDRLKTEFLTNMSHELRTPLNSIIGFSDVIISGIDGPISEMQRADVESILHSGQHLLRLINNILDLSRIEAGKAELNCAEVDLPFIIEKVLKASNSLINTKSLILERRLPAHFPPLWADSIRLHQILLNLVSNAIKFTQQGKITITVTYDHSWLFISVRDTGIGIPQDKLTEIFREFTQVDGTTSRRFGGTGLGLAISKKLVEMHGGEIWAESELNIGSVFTFKLPVRTLATKTNTFSELVAA